MKPTDSPITEDAQLPAQLAMARSTALLSGKMRVAIVVGLIFAGMAYFAVTTITAATVEYMKVDKVVESSGIDANQTVGVLGKLVPDSYIKSPDGITANFRIRDEGGMRELPVVYDGEIGQVFFNDHSEIILNGRIQSDGVFHADLLTVRCPSKYLTEQERQEIEGDADPPPYQADYFNG